MFVKWLNVNVCADVSCECPPGYVGNGDYCNGVLTNVLATYSNFSIFYKVSVCEGWTISARIKEKVFKTVLRLAMLYGLERVALKKGRAQRTGGRGEDAEVPFERLYWFLMCLNKVTSTNYTACHCIVVGLTYNSSSSLSAHLVSGHVLLVSPHKHKIKQTWFPFLVFLECLKYCMALCVSSTLTFSSSVFCFCSCECVMLIAAGCDFPATF